ncbi:hypothetical protein JRG42_20570 [Pseudomonas granadensis]|uniref:Uncharacterized protein n=1 Tax=Pseudomonas granadensis TaxID=1421430 RepID=A0ABX7GM60_9PSED|nr:hypothetical protein [Pseudomonas granadensis]MBN6775538.1 hypothetical protein [Pseudomonas granadensis]MBN6806831.1 hypothetical protein [Pseudomonas granadensis]MBN6833512.1 hypothetical protein [Pseudomonas granadensis]MBN6841077.1 hypothetical protein [Pseudomonas granadensis]MBN6866520.1 hypothetical protein [Pseudomonas granadensis]
MANRQTYTVLVPFPTGRGHWSSVGQELELLDVEASALHSAGRLQLKTTSTQAKKAAAKKAD